MDSSFVLVDIPEGFIVEFDNTRTQYSEGQIYSWYKGYGEIIVCGVDGRKGFIQFSKHESATEAMKYENLSLKETRNAKPTYLDKVLSGGKNK